MTDRAAGAADPLDAIVAQAARLGPLEVAVPAAASDPVLQGMQEAMKALIVRPFLVGEPASIRRAWSSLRLGTPPDIVVPDAQESALDCAVRLVREGRARALAKGGLHTDELMRAVLRDLSRDGLVSHVYVLGLRGRRTPLLVTDAAVNIRPDLRTKAATARNAVDLAHRLGIARPRVAVLSAVAKVRPALPSSIDAACLAKMGERGQIAGAVIDGPLALDNAISGEAAQIKGIDGAVAGEADILLVPDIEAGNILVKALVHLAGATPGGVVMGADVPVLLTSRADPPRARLVSAALASIVAGPALCCEQKGEAS